MAAVDPYHILGVPLTATAAEVKGAFRRLAHRYHPDTNPDDPDATRHFQELVDAYEVLSNPRRRARFDRESTGFRRAPARPHGQPGDPRPAPRRRPGVHGRDVPVTATITLAEVVTGTEKRLRISRADSCRSCRGAGVLGREAWVRCTSCGGAGRLKRTEGVFRTSRACLACNGEGETTANPCPACAGRSLVDGRASLRVAIPPGVRSGTVIRYAAQGDAGLFGGARGDLLLTLEVAEHELFERDGADLCSTVLLTPAQAALGTTVPVELLDGKTTNVRVRPGVQPPDVTRLGGEGLPKSPKAKARGDLRIQFAVRVPPRLEPAERYLYVQLAALEAPRPRPRPAWRDLLRRIRRA